MCARWILKNQAASQEEEEREEEGEGERKEKEEEEEGRVKRWQRRRGRGRLKHSYGGCISTPGMVDLFHLHAVEKSLTFFFSH